MEQSPSWEVNTSSATEEIPRILMETEGSLSHSQEPATCPHPEPDQSSPCPPPIQPLEDPFSWTGKWPVKYDRVKWHNLDFKLLPWNEYWFLVLGILRVVRGKFPGEPRRLPKRRHMDLSKTELLFSR
jgi:hypothetical protein